MDIHISAQEHIVVTYEKHLAEALLMSTHSICFYGEIRKLLWLRQANKVLSKMRNRIMLRMHKVSCMPLFSIETFCGIQ